MFTRLKNHYIARQVVNYEKLPLFHQSIDELEILIGQYGYGLERLADILTNDGTTEERVLHNATVQFNDSKNLALRGIDKETKMPFEMIIDKHQISWHQTNHTHIMGIDEEFELCDNPNEGVFDIQLKNGESVLLCYLLDKNKEFDFVL